MAVRHFRNIVLFRIYLFPSVVGERNSAAGNSGSSTLSQVSKVMTVLDCFGFIHLLSLMERKLPTVRCLGFVLIES